MNEMRCRRVYYVNHMNVLLEQLSLSHVCVSHNASAGIAHGEGVSCAVAVYVHSIHKHSHADAERYIIDALAAC
jgi:hypothetical protein